MKAALEDYAEIAGRDVVEHLRELAAPLAGKTVVHVNSTRVGGGVAEILERLIPLKRELGIDASWDVVKGSGEFFDLTKRLHNGLQGLPVELPRRLTDAYIETNRENAAAMRERLEAADLVFIHDPQPAALLGMCPGRRGKWVWRCHIDASRPHRPVWKFLRELVGGFDASVFSLASFAQPLPHPQYLIAPSIDPLSDKNLPLDDREIDGLLSGFDLDPSRPILLQVSRFDRFKDPVGVIRAYRLVRPHAPVQLVLAGGTASDDPEGEAVLREVRDEAGDDPDIHLLMLPPDAHRTINGLQRRADIVLQKSIREGFGLTVAEALWKSRPVVAGETGGIVLQVFNNHTGFLVNTPEGAAFRIRYLLNHPAEAMRMGQTGHRFVRENYLLTRHLREYLTLMVALLHGARDRIELSR